MYTFISKENVMSGAPFLRPSFGTLREGRTFQGDCVVAEL